MNNSKKVKKVGDNTPNDSLIERNYQLGVFKTIGGVMESRCAVGIIDLETDFYVIEFKKPPDFKQAIGQVLAYAFATNKIPVVATWGEISSHLLDFAFSLDIEVWDVRCCYSKSCKNKKSNNILEEKEEKAQLSNEEMYKAFKERRTRFNESDTISLLNFLWDKYISNFQGKEIEVEILTDFWEVWKSTFYGMINKFIYILIDSCCKEDITRFDQIFKCNMIKKMENRVKRNIDLITYEAAINTVLLFQEEMSTLKTIDACLFYKIVESIEIKASSCFEQTEAIMKIINDICTKVVKDSLYNISYEELNDYQKKIVERDILREKTFILEYLEEYLIECNKNKAKFNGDSFLNFVLDKLKFLLKLPVDYSISE